jgi:chromosome segregation ATPase
MIAVPVRSPEKPAMRDNPTLSGADLDQRIAAAFRDGTRPEDVTALIAEADAASIAAGEAADRARGRALDPALTAKAVAEARRQMEDASFRSERLQSAVTRLRDRLQELVAQEEDQQRLVAYKKAKAARDKLADELRATYPAIEAQLRDLLPRLAANDREIERINAHALPRTGGRLLVAELVARGLPAS